MAAPTPGVPPNAPRDFRARGAFPARIGALLVTPARALADVERWGGGFRDTIWLAVIGVIAFRMEALAREVLAVSHVPPLNLFLHLLGTISREIREVAFIVLPASVAITVVAGRGRRDPARDMELGAACYLPFFAARVLIHLLQLPELLGPLPLVGRAGLFWAGTAGAALYLFLSLRIARRRVPRGGDAVEGVMGPVSAPVSDTGPGLPARLAVTALAGALGLVLFSNAVWIFHHHNSVRPLRTGQPAPTFDLARVDGGAPNRIALSSLRGQVVLLDFWATWCPPCVKMMPSLHDLHDKWGGQGVAFLGIHAADTPAAEIADFLRDNPVPYPVVRDEEDDTGLGGQVAGQFKVTGLPHLVLLDRQGQVFKAFWGYTSQGALDAAIAEATARKNQ